MNCLLDSERIAYYISLLYLTAKPFIFKTSTKEVKLHSSKLKTTDSAAVFDVFGSENMLNNDVLR